MNYQTDPLNFYTSYSADQSALTSINQAANQLRGSEELEQESPQLQCEVINDKHKCNKDPKLNTSPLSGKCH